MGQAGDDGDRRGEQQGAGRGDHQERHRSYCGAAYQPRQCGAARTQAAWRSASRITGADSAPAWRAGRTVPA
ncbi:hypothetical protein ACIO5Z_35510 [Streptomyces rochei]|uniref:hypothetical protein n=1 Tax=Streptomyces TaxID=1883 RepID=UPI0002EFD2B9